MYSVYALTDPRDGAIRYIGMSRNAWRRYAMHIVYPGRNNNPGKKAWVEELRKVDLSPLLNILGTAETEEEALKLETQWIQRYLSEGISLLNIFKTGKRRLREPKEGWGVLLEEFRREYPNARYHKPEETK